MRRGYVLVGPGVSYTMVCPLTIMPLHSFPQFLLPYKLFYSLLLIGHDTVCGETAPVVTRWVRPQFSKLIT